MPSDMYPAALGDILADESTKAEYQLIDCREKDELSRADIRGAGFLLLPISEFQQVRTTDTEARQGLSLFVCVVF